MTSIASRLRRPFAMPAAAREAALPCLVAAATLAAELLLVERKYAIFGGGFGQSQPLAGGESILLFAVTLAAAHLLLVGLLYLALRRLHRAIGPRTRALFPLNFLVLVPGLFAAGLAAKYEVLSYFSDAVSFQLIRNLGGGSLFDALLFALSEGALTIGAVVGGLAVYALVARGYLRRVGKKEDPHPNPAKDPHPIQCGSFLVRPGDEPSAALPHAGEGALAVRARWMVLFALVVAGLLLGARSRDDVRSALGRFTSVWVLSALLDEVSDVDRDGYGVYAQPADRWPFDGARYPYALDVPGNGVDEDGIGGDFRPARAIAAPAAGAALLPGAKRHLVVIVLESVRFDAIGRRYAGRAVTPNIDALAARGSSFPAAYSHVGFTTASLKSLFSGQLEPQRGSASLFRDMKANGYRIGVFSGQPESFGDISEVSGMRAAADVFADGETLEAERAFGFAAKGSLLVDGKVLLREFDRNFGARADWERPVFLYVNFQSAHFPYHNPDMEQLLPGTPIPRGRISASERDWVAATYWNAVAQADSQVGALIARLKRLGVYDDSLILVTADHGESLFDDGFLGHGHMINAQQTHIPLVVSDKGVASAAPVGLADYRGLILRLLGAEQPDARARPVLQYIGTLDRPSRIGMVEAGGRWTVLDTATRRVSFGDLATARDYEALGDTPALKARADRLVQAWEAARWERRLGSP